MSTYQDLRSRPTRIFEKIAAIMGSHSADLCEKRDRLHNVLVRESDHYHEELELQKQKKAEAYFEERKNKSMLSLVQLEEKRKQLAKRQLELYLQQNSEELKINEVNQKCWEAAAYNKVAMEERNKMEAKMNQLEYTLEGLFQQHNLKQIEEEDRIAQRKMEIALHDCTILKNQIIEKRLQIEEKILSDVEDYERLKQSAKKYEEDDEQELLKKRKEKHQLAKEKHENMIHSIAKRKEKELFERELEKNLCQMQLMGNEIQPSYDKEQLRLEQDLFLETQHNLRDEMKRAEALEDELRQLEYSKQDKIEMKTRLKEEIMKKKQYKDVLQTQIMQIMASRKLDNVQHAD